MKKAFNICKTVFITILLIILLFELSLGVVRLISPTNYPKLFGYSKAVVMSGSMEDEISVGDLLIYKTQDEYYPGDIIIFYDAKIGGFVTHRIQRIENGKFITKGDANNIEDADPVSRENIHGKVIKKIDNVGSVISFITSPIFIGGMVLIIGIILLYPYFKKESKGGNEENER